jgi:hypothetical protein
VKAFETVFVKINYSSGGGAAGEALALFVRRRCTACRTEIGICNIIFIVELGFFLMIRPKFF